MSVEKNGKCWRVSYKHNGQLYRESYPSKEAADARNAAIKAAKAARSFVPPHELLDPQGEPTDYGKDITIAEMAERIKGDYARDNWKPNVRRTNCSRIDGYIIPLIGKYRLKDMTTARWDWFFAQLQVTPSIDNPEEMVGPSVLEKVRQLCSTIMGEALRLEYISQDERDRVLRAKCPSYHSNEKTIWTIAEFIKALNSCRTIQMRVLLKLAAQASQRIGELTGLLWEDVHIQPDGTAELVFRRQLQRLSVADIKQSKHYTSFIEVPSGVTTKDKQPPKTRLYLVDLKYLGAEGTAPPPHSVFVGKDLAADLQELFDRQEIMKRMLGDAYLDIGFVLAQDNGRPYEEHTIRKYLRQLCEENGLPIITPHALRHWSISFKMLATGGDISQVKVIQSETGQRNTQMVLDRYSHAFKEERKKMANIIETALNEKTQEFLKNS